MLPSLLIIGCFLYFVFKAAYSLYENKDNGEVFSKEEQQNWNKKKESKSATDK